MKVKVVLGSQGGGGGKGGGQHCCGAAAGRRRGEGGRWGATACKAKGVKGETDKGKEQRERAGGS